MFLLTIEPVWRHRADDLRTWPLTPEVLPPSGDPAAGWDCVAGTPPPARRLQTSLTCSHLAWLMSTLWLLTIGHWPVTTLRVTTAIECSGAWTNRLTSQFAQGWTCLLLTRSHQVSRLSPRRQFETILHETRSNLQFSDDNYGFRNMYDLSCLHRTGTQSVVIGEQYWPTFRKKELCHH